MTPAERARAPRGQGDRLREELLDAAEQLLVERGSVDAVSVRQIVEHVGCTPPAMYLHFEDKDGLFREVCGRRFEEFGAALEEAAADATDPLDELQRRGMAYVRYGLEHPEAYRVLFLARSDERNWEMTEDDPGMRALSALVAAVQRAIDAGALVADDAPTVAVALWAAVHGTTALLLNQPSGEDGPLVMPGVEALTDRVLQMCIDGLRPR
ncbi:MAG: TetR/AcrR family transcriptional regulator [Actinobacteria bacterium]|nr:TetR/AcrR family transcriptional regulator [Actinomycetota bacterium]